MQITYDPRYNIAYLRLKDKVQEVQTIRVGDALNIDLTPDGTIYGIELLNANEQLSQDHGSLIFINEALGKRDEIPLIS